MTSLSNYQNYIAKSRYSRYVPEMQRREHWDETVNRYVKFMQNSLMTKSGYDISAEVPELEAAIVNLEVMPSMRALMTSGKALERSNVAAFNCSYLPVDDPKCFDEAMYILLCFHPDTLVQCRTGDKRIADILVGDEVVSFNETTQCFEYKTVTASIRTPSASRPKVSVVLDNGLAIKCTADHKWLTSNRGYVEAQYLTVSDDLVAPTHEIYRHTCTVTGKAYIGQTSKGTHCRMSQHKQFANVSGRSGYDSHFYKAIRKYGEDVWVTDVLDVAYSSAEAASKEILYICQYDTLNNGYNMTSGGEGACGYRWTDEQKQRASDTAYVRTPELLAALSESMKCRQEGFIEQRRTPEARERARIQNTGAGNPMYGKKHSPERLAQIREQTTGSRNPFFGKKHSEETKLKISETKKRQKMEACV